MQLFWLVVIGGIVKLVGKQHARARAEARLLKVNEAAACTSRIDLWFLHCASA